MNPRPGTVAPTFTRTEPEASFSVPVRNRPYLAGSDHDSFPESVPDAGEMIPVLAVRDGGGAQRVLAAAVREVVDELLPRYGGVRLTGLPLADRAAFEQLVTGMGYDRLAYHGGIAVRRVDSEVALAASEEDHRITLSPHNEMAYLATYPRRAIFFCESPATVGGEVPVNDIRETLTLIPEQVRELFQEKGIRYHRNLPRQSSAGEMGWVDTFGTDDRQAVEGHLAASNYDFWWGEGDRLHYNYRRAAFATHPETGETLWFNQVTELHSSYWRSHPGFPSDLSDDDYPATTTFGDGTPLTGEQVAFLRGTLWRTTRAVRMRAGDVLVLDNQVVQHGRFAYEGPRRHFVSLTR
ncbi:Taurine dioxygenase, alpha-ketoglutarate-dependent [Micromonospora nigra]|uniref:Taurine dioxygenase, alpha-ketoglutarate-dependent n=1 Tax=Micromonospora nigra TaxID=145857 RepID=A0A1C6S7R1_9ACTN|nr:TauD/TfdA family dioxygenase [Micromonospora nigra]SCL25421.1 Taurine dioxygenase, alpha-ketoglutarate-dependent [Micromonospora nigra]